MSKLLPVAWSVPDRIRARLGARAGRPRAMSHEGHCLVILQSAPRPGDAAREPSFFWRAPDGAWKSIGGSGKGGLKALREHVEAYTAEAERLESHVEGAQRAADYYRVLQEVGPLLRASRGLHKALQDARDATNDPEIITLRDQAGDIERAVELVYDDAQNGLGYTTARQAEEQAALSTNIAQAGHRLNRLAALFLPMSALGSVLGMNLVHGFEGRYAPWLFWCAVAATFSLGFLVRATLPSDERLRKSPS